MWLLIVMEFILISKTYMQNQLAVQLGNNCFKNVNCFYFKLDC